MKLHIRSLAGAGSALTLAVLSCAPTVNAQEFNLSVSAGASHSDNIGRTNEDEQSESMADLGLQLGVDDQVGRLQAVVGADLLYRTYLDNTYDDSFIGGLNGTVTYWFAPERFSWVVEDNFGQTFIDPQAVETPDNRQYTNFLSTGPNFLIGLGSRTDLSLQGRWSDASFEDSDADNQRLSGTIGLIRHLSARSSVSLNGTVSRIEYEEPTLFSNYDSQSAYLGFSSTGARTTLNLQAGYTAMHDFGDTQDGPLFSLAISRQLSERSTLSLNAGTSFTDSAQAFRRDQDIDGVDVGNDSAIVTGDPFQADYATLAWDVQGTRNTFELSADWRQDDHEREETANRNSIGAHATLSRRLNPVLTLALDGAWSHSEFEESDNEFDDWSAGVSLNWNFARNFSLDLRGDHFDGSGDTSQGSGVRDYTENRVTLRVGYTPEF